MIKILCALALAVWLVGCGGDIHAATCAQEGKLCNTQVSCCAGLICDTTTSGSDRCVKGNPTTSIPTTSTTVKPTSTSIAGSTTTTSTPPTTIVTNRDDAPTPARFPTGWDISIRQAHNQRCRWWTDDGVTYRTATQAERAAMFLQEVAVTQPDAMTFGKTVPGCAGVVRGARGDYETDQLRLRSFYVDIQRDKEWGIFGQNGCHPYQHVENLLERLQTCATSKASDAQACAKSFYLSGDLLDAMDLRIVNGACVKGSLRATPVFPEKEDQDLRERGHLFYTKPLPQLTTGQRAKARRVMVLHEQASLAKCGLGNGPESSVKAAELDLLKSATSERQKHAFMMIFTGKVDTTTSGWTAQDICDLGMLQHFAWHAWDGFLDLPGEQMWGELTRARVSHETAHLIAAYRDPNIRWRLGNHVTRIMDEPARTQDQLLACLRDGSCRPAWLPSDWRVIVGPDHTV